MPRAYMSRLEARTRARAMRRYGWPGAVAVHMDRGEPGPSWAVKVGGYGDPRWLQDSGEVA